MELAKYEEDLYINSNIRYPAHKASHSIPDQLNQESKVLSSSYFPEISSSSQRGAGGCGSAGPRYGQI